MRTCILAVGVLVAVSASSAFAQTGNGAPPGGHYSLNIIGVSNPKTADLTGSERHTIFVALGKGGVVKSNIYLVPGEEFRVCDGNGFETAHNCDGTPTTKIGAVFQLPCNTNLDAGTDPDGEPSTLFPCEEKDPQLAYEVWARALGTPGGRATMTTCADEVSDVDGDGVLEHVCSTENVLFVRDPGKSIFTDVTQELTSLVACFDVNADPTIEDIDCFRYALFRSELEDWVWEFDNNGLKLAQLRFYPVEE